MTSNPLSRIAQSIRGLRTPPAPDMERGSAGPNGTLPQPAKHVDLHGRPAISPDDALNLFRHLTGITSHPSMSQTRPLFGGGGGRAAPNIGIYPRIIHNEQDAKRGYHRFSWLINCCLGLQIIVAAALTAMGAAGASHSAVTVFGAINTVIAGFLTFLKGSGLPNRLKYYQAEWKQVREFIEQRERDLSRPNCDLDVYAVVDMVEKMYESVKADLEATVPDRFAGIRGGMKSQNAGGAPGEVGSPVVNLPRVGTNGLNAKLKEVEAGFGGNIKDMISGLAHKSNTVTAAQGEARDLEEKARALSGNATKQLQEHADQAQRLGDGVTRGLKEHSDQVQKLGDDVTKGLQEQTDRAQHLGDDAAEVLKAEIDRAQRIGETSKIIEGDATRALDEHVTQARQIEEQAKAAGTDIAGSLEKEIESAKHAESNFLAKLKDLRSEIGNKSHLAQEAMHFLQDAYHHAGHDHNDGGKKMTEHNTGPGASS